VIATRLITKDDLVRAAQINDAIALEHGLTEQGALLIGKQLGVDLRGAALMGAEHARRRVASLEEEAVVAVTHAFTMGVVVGLRAVEVVGRA